MSKGFGVVTASAPELFTRLPRVIGKWPSRDTWALPYSPCGDRETKATTADCPADGEWLGIRFKLGTFMPLLPAGDLRDRRDVTLPEASSRSFWLNGSAWEYPDFENAETFVKRLVHDGLIAVDPSVAEALDRADPCTDYPRGAAAVVFIQYKVYLSRYGVSPSERRQPCQQIHNLHPSPTVCCGEDGSSADWWCFS